MSGVMCSGENEVICEKKMLSGVASPPENLVPLCKFQAIFKLLSFLWKWIVFTVNEHENICIAGLNRQAGGYATAFSKHLYVFREGRKDCT